MTTTIIPQSTTILAPLADIVDQASSYVQQSKAPNTWRAYAADWRDFERWCAMRDVQAIPATPETVALYLTELAERCKVSTLQRRMSAISQAHQTQGIESPTRALAVRSVMAGVRRVKGVAQHGKAAAVTDTIRLMVSTIDDTLLGTRDRALLLVGFAGAFRRSELVALDVADVAFSREGMTITLRRSKTDQEGQGRKIGIPYGLQVLTCPVRALKGWIEAAGISDGAIFRSVNRHGQVQPQRLTAQSVALVVKRCAVAAGMDAEVFAGHSLRAGLATSAAAAGVSERAIMDQTGHRSTTMVRKYIREGSLFRENAAGSVGL